VKQEAWTKNKFDEVFAKKGRFKKADVKKQYADYTPTINTQVNIIKNKLPDMFAKKGRFVEADVTMLNAELKLPVNTPVNIVTRNIKNKCPQGRTKPNHNPRDQVTTSVLELDEATVEEREYEE
jgi:hypothetical protein